MVRHILSGVPMALIVLSIASIVQSLDNSNTQWEASTPFKSDFAYNFFTLGADSSHNQTTRAVDSTKCFQDFDTIVESLRNYEEWAIQFPDSWGRLPVGLMWGHTISMGQYEECIAIESTKAFTNIQGQYCLARVPIKSFFDKIKPIKNQVSRISYQYKAPEYFELGICIPKSCSPSQSNDILKRVIKKFYNINVDADMVRENFCKTDEPIVLRPIDIFAICFICFIVFCLIGSSIYDYVKTKNNQPKSPLLLSFSVLTNAPKIFSAKKVNNPNMIHCLNGLRTLSMMWVVLGHGFMTFYDLPHINKNRVYTWIESPFSMLIQNGSLCVDTFFFMSGLLVLWGAFREMEKAKGKLHIPMMYFHRYVRLTPVVAVVILYIMSLYKYSGAGPMWMKLGIQDQRCSNTWWATLLYVQNYVYPYKICVSQSWYLAVDTQLYVLSPLVLIPLWKWGKKAVPFIVVFAILCLGCTFATFMYNDFTLFRVQDDHVDLRQTLTYYPTHTRIATWLIGVLFGYYLFTKNRGRQIPLEKHWVITGWVLALAIMLTDLWGPYWRILPQNPNAPIIEGAFYEPLSRTAWALSMAWIVWACYNGHGGIINDFLSWGFFTAFSRLTYCMYVIHRIVQLVNAARLQTDTHFSNYDALLRWWQDFGWTLVASIFATLAFESPILGIEKAIFSKSPAPKIIEPKLATEREPITTLTETYSKEPVKA